MENVYEVVLRDTKFKGQEDTGTALELIETTARIINSTFMFNRRGKFNIVSVGPAGGAIIATHSNIDISQSNFEQNGARVGGAIFAEEHSIITMNNTTFTGNRFCNHNNCSTERSWGGAIQMLDSHMRIMNCHFDHNTATDGGVLFSFRSIVEIEASEFEKNNGRLGAVLLSHRNTFTIKTSVFDSNTATYVGGVVYSISRSIVTIDSCVFDSNTAVVSGGVLASSGSTVTIESSVFDGNFATESWGGVLVSVSSVITIGESVFDDNTASREGGVMSVIGSRVTVQTSVFDDNIATWGGVVYSKGSTITIESSEFDSNIATRHGGVLLASESTITIEASLFDNNNSTYVGGVIHSHGNTITIVDCSFTNSSSSLGAVIYAAEGATVNYHGFLLAANNSIIYDGIIHLVDSEFKGNFSENSTFSNNLGSFVAFNSNITFTGSVTFINNIEPTVSDNFHEGGAITLFESNALFDGTCSFEHNHAESGGAILSTESKLTLNGDMFIAHNTATRNGGGIYLLNSELRCQWNSNIVLFDNTATLKGGGVQAISSSIKAISALDEGRNTYTGTRLNFSGNKARKGGGLSLEANARLYVWKHDHITSTNIDANTTVFSANIADYGAAMYVDDDTNSGACTRTECFFQALGSVPEGVTNFITQNMYFSLNQAEISGSTLYGGLLDRCAVNQFAEARYKSRRITDNGVSYFTDASAITKTTISSRPVQVCLCIGNELDCTQEIHIEVKKGETFTVSLVAVDQVGHPVNGTIQTSLNFTESGLAEGQLAREIPAKCTALTFNVVSPHSSEEVTLYASDGPCKDAELSKRTIEVWFLPCSCPFGLQPSDKSKTNCTCECHRDISQYVECDLHTGSFVRLLTSQSKTWISYINDTKQSGHLVYSNCPFDYCNSLRLSVDLSEPNGADVQCAFNRSSLLCGSCQPDLSLSLGSSRCLSCPGYWPVLLVTITIAAILAGLALVALLLVLNMTVAVGTLNGLIFYANVLYANKSILLPFQERNFVTLFVSWLNLELGIDTCYYPGMDTYTKTWLQLAFPAYVIFLVVLVIIVSSYSSKFSNLIGKKNPVATLATLILLSYAKLLEITFKALSVGILDYPDGSTELVWLPDANIKYLSGKHIPLFIAAVLILLVGLAYTALLFSWQWLLHLPKWKILRRLREQKLQNFMETYHAPYTPKHRYWTGLLLLARAILYLVAAVNVSNDPHIALTAINFTVCCIVLLKGFVGISRLYREWPVDVLETVFYTNILFLAVFSYQEINQELAAYTSVITTFIMLLFIILYHVYTYTSAFSKVNKTKAGKMLKNLLKTDPNPKPKDQNPPPDDDTRRFHDILEMMDDHTTDDDYELSLQNNSTRLSYSIVEIPKPHTPLTRPEEVNVQRNSSALEVGHVEVDKDNQVQNREVEGKIECCAEK